MARTSNIYVRVEPELKEQAEDVLGQLGIPMSNAVGIFLRQVVLQRGIPFDVKLPEKPLEVGSLSEEQLNAELKKGIDGLKDGKTSSANRVAERIQRDYHV